MSRGCCFCDGSGNRDYSAWCQRYRALHCAVLRGLGSVTSATQCMRSQMGPRHRQRSQSDGGCTVLRRRYIVDMLVPRGSTVLVLVSCQYRESTKTRMLVDYTSRQNKTTTDRTSMNADNPSISKENTIRPFVCASNIVRRPAIVNSSCWLTGFKSRVVRNRSLEQGGGPRHEFRS